MSDLKTYIRCQWMHDNSDYPKQLFSELDGDRFEVRKIEYFASGKLGLADGTISTEGTELGVVPVPSIEEINQDHQFRAEEMSEVEFDAQWEIAKNSLPKVE